MKSMVKVFAVMAVLFGSFAVQATTENPYKLIQRVAETTFKRIATDNGKIAANANHLKTIVDDELMPYIDYELAAKMVLGRTKASSEEKQAFFTAFKGYLVTTYATVFTKYTDQKVVFEAEKPIEGKKVVTVQTRIIDENRPDINIDFKVRLDKRTSTWKAFDMVAEGISLLNSKKAELKPLLRQQDGVAKVTKLLNEKAQLNIVKSAG